MIDNLILGAPGQDAYYISKLLKKNNESIKIVARPKPLPDHYSCFSNDLLFGDLTDSYFVDSIIIKYKPNNIYNFAGISNIGFSLKNPSLTINNNTSIQTNILESVKNHCPETKVYFASSVESFKLKSPYGLSKHICHQINDYYNSNFNIFIASGVNCQHHSIYRDQSFFWGKVCRYIADLKKFLDSNKNITFNSTTIQSLNHVFPKLKIGNLEVSRDVLSCEDIVLSAKLILEKGNPFNYIVTSGNLYSNKLILEMAFNHIGITDCEKFYYQDKSLFRPIEDIGTVYYSNRLEKDTGWKPSVSVENLLKESIDYAISRVN